MKKLFEKLLNPQITSFIFNAQSGGKSSSNHLIKFIKISLLNLENISKIVEKLCPIKYTVKEIKIVNIFDIKVEKKNTKESNISNLKKVKISDQIINLVISISLKYKTHKKSNDWNNIISKIVELNHKNFQKIKSYLLIGLLKIKNIVFHSISL